MTKYDVAMYVGRPAY